VSEALSLIPHLIIPFYTFQIRTLPVCDLHAKLANSRKKERLSFMGAKLVKRIKKSLKNFLIISNEKNKETI